MKNIWYIIGILFFVFIGWTLGKRQAEPKVERVYVNKPILIDKPIYSSIIIPIVDTISTPIDTVAIIEDYFSRVLYNDINLILPNKVGKISLDVELFKNRIDTLKWKYDLSLPQPDKNIYFVGMSTVGPEVLYVRNFGSKYSYYFRVGILPFNAGAGVGLRK